MDDLAACSDAQAAAETLRARQAAELIFTRLGTQPVALTPARPLPALYSTTAHCISVVADYSVVLCTICSVQVPRRVRRYHASTRYSQSI